MAQQKAAPSVRQKTIQEVRKPAAPKKPLIPEKARTPLSILALFISLLIFFNGVLGTDKAFNAGDNIASESMLPYLKAAQAAGDNVPQWIPNIFCGMPSFAALMSTGTRTYDIVHQIFDWVRSVPVALFGGNDAMIHLWHYFIFGLGMYLLLRIGRKTSHFVALFAGISAMFSSWIITYVMIGHNTKIFAVMTFPYILLCLEKLREKLTWQQTLLWVSALGMSLHFLLESSHVQMEFYILLAVMIYFVIWLISDLFGKKNLIPFLRTGVLAALMVVIAFAMSADRYLATLGYGKYSIRGSTPLVDRATVTGEQPKANATTGATKAGGLDWNYATEYSFSPGEMITFLIPGWYGFGKLPYDGPEMAPGTRVPGYWGQMTVTDTANYTGIVVFFLAMIAIFTLWKRDRLVPPLAIISLFALLLSFGSNWPILYKPMFEYFPTMNSYRAPMMALVLMQLCFPILAALALDRIMRIMKDEDNKQLKARLLKVTTYAMYAAAAFFVISLIGRGAIESSITSAIAKSGKAPAQYGWLKDLDIKTAVNDAAFCSLLALIAVTVLWLYQRGKSVTASVALSVVFIASLIDLWRVDTRPMDIVTKSEYDQNLNTHDYVEFIKQDKSIFRILDVGETTSNIPVAWGLQTIVGYSAAKVRLFQDVVDVTGNAQGQFIFNPFMWSLLNTKYIIATGAVDSVQGRMVPAFISKEKTQNREGKPTQTVVWQNTQVLPRAFFVNRYEVKPPLEMLGKMRDGAFNPRDEVFFDANPEGVGTLGANPVNDSLESVTITKYENEFVEIKTKSQGDHLLFMSDTWNPNWKAAIDEKAEIPIYKANYTFRAVKIPAGEHTLTMRYNDPNYGTGRNISLATNILALLGLGTGLGFEWKKRKKVV